jgi:MerR family transcriptional regulator, redox-sensitive transcriptional activator SoxR
VKTLSIGEVARRSGVRTSALRYYEDAGILPATARVGGRRVYDSDMLRRIDVLRFAQQAGFTLDEIKTLFHGFGSSTPLSARWHKLANAKLKELDALAERVQLMRRALKTSLECGCVRIEDCTLSPADATESSLRTSKSKRACSC